MTALRYSSTKNDREDQQLVAERFAKITNNIKNKILSSSVKVPKNELAKTDIDFLLAILSEASTASIYEQDTKEKKKLLRRIKSKSLFQKSLKENGGTLNSKQTSELLGVSKVTVKSRKDTGKLLAIIINGEFHYPTFQFSEDINLSENGVLKGIEPLLKIIQEKGISDRMQYSFFIKELPIFSEDKPLKVFEILAKKNTPEVMDELKRQARLFGTQDAS